MVSQIIRLRFLDPKASAEVIAQKLRQTGVKVSVRSVERTITEYGLQKKLHQLNPDLNEPTELEVQSTKRRKKSITITPQSNERGVREILAGKLSGTHLGVWLLIPELLRLGGWDLLTATFGRRAMDPRIALQLVGESAVCVDRIRRKGSLCNQGFCLAAGLSVLASDHSVHQLLDSHSMADYEELQATLMQLRRLAGHYHSPQVLAMDPHRMVSASRRRMPAKKKKPDQPSQKMLQTFFCTDITSRQPLGFTMGSPGKSCTHATRHLAEQVLTNMEGDLRVKDDTIIVTFYRDHHQLDLARHYQNLPQILASEGVNPKIPWLFDFKLDFRFK